jgi:hypothetical protein
MPRVASSFAPLVGECFVFTSLVVQVGNIEEAYKLFVL